jgi:hypothetical protein
MSEFRAMPIAHLSLNLKLFIVLYLLLNPVAMSNLAPSPALPLAPLGPPILEATCPGLTVTKAALQAHTRENGYASSGSDLWYNEVCFFVLKLR